MEWPGKTYTRQSNRSCLAHIAFPYIYKSLSNGDMTKLPIMSLPVMDLFGLTSPITKQIN